MWKNRIAWLLVLASALALYLFENNTGTRILLLCAVVCPLCAALCVFVPRPRLSVVLEVPASVTRGKAAACTLILENAGPLPLSLVRCTLDIRNPLTGERGGLTTISAVGARGTVATAFSVEAGHCGRLAVQVTDIKILDLFGLFARSVPCQMCMAALVLPVVSPVELSLSDTADFLTDSQHYSPQRPGCDPSETFRIREYVPGDPIRQIHWKLSQKTDTVLVRELGLPVADTVLLLLETAALEGPPVTPEDMDEMLDLLFSVSHALLARDVPHTVGWQSRDCGCEYREIYAVDDLVELQSLLLSNEPGAGEAAAGCYGRGHIQYAHVAVFSTYLSPDVSLLCHRNRVTVLMPGKAASQPGFIEAGLSVVPFTGAELRHGGLHLEL